MLRSLKDKLRPFVDRTQSALKTDVRYAAKGGLWLTLGQGVSMLSSFALAVAFANLLPREAYGTYKYLMGLAGIVAAFHLNGILTSLMRAIARGSDGLLKKAFAASYRWNGIVGLLALGAAGYYAYKGNFTLGAGLAAVGILDPLANSLGVYGAKLHARKDFRRTTAYSVTANVALTLTLVVAIILTDSPAAIVAAFFLVKVLVHLFFYARVSEGETAEALPREVLPYARHLTAMDAMMTVATHIDKVILFQAIGPVGVGTYAFADAPPEQIKSLTKILNTLLLPKFSERGEEEIRATMVRKMLLVTAFLAPVTLAYVLLAPFLYALLFPAYLDSVAYSQVLALVIPISGLSVVPIAFLTAKMAVRERYVLTTVAPALRILLMLVLVGPFGIWGIVIAVITTKALNAVLATVFALRARRPVIE